MKLKLRQDKSINSRLGTVSTYLNTSVEFDLKLSIYKFGVEVFLAPKLYDSIIRRSISSPEPLQKFYVNRLSSILLFILLMFTTVRARPLRQTTEQTFATVVIVKHQRVENLLYRLLFTPFHLRSRELISRLSNLKKCIRILFFLFSIRRMRKKRHLFDNGAIQTAKMSEMSLNLMWSMKN